MLPIKQLSGHLKWKRKKQIETNIESQKGALNNFFVKHPITSVQNDAILDNLDFEAENLENELLNRNIGTMKSKILWLEP